MDNPTPTGISPSGKDPPASPLLPDALTIDGPNGRIGEIAFRHRLGVRLALAISAASLAAMGALIFVGIWVEERHLLGEMTQGALLFSDTIRSSTRDHMLRDEKAAAYQIMERIGRLKGVDSVRMFRKDGSIAWSTIAAEIGTKTDKQSGVCGGCHFSSDAPAAPLPADFSRNRVFARNGHRVLGIVTPIYNEEACSSNTCHAHPAGQKVLGVVDVGMSLDRVDAGLARFRRQALSLALVAALLLAVFVLAATRRLVLQPVREIVRATRRVAAGDLDHEVPVRAPDELGQTALSFNLMRGSLRQARRELSDLMAGLEVQIEERTAALKRAQIELAQGEKLTSLGRLSASIAHEINNPLSGILTFTKLLIRSIDDAKDTDHWRDDALRQLRLIQRETERCRDIVRNLLDFARQRPATPREIDLVPALDESLSLVGHQVELEGIRLEKSISGPAVVRADFGQMRQALVNILLNACAAMPSGGTLSVSLRPRPDDRMAEVTIEDTGIGIPEEDLGRIFDPFFTTKEKGTGLGLSVVYGIIEQAGGWLDVSSEVGRGTKVRIRLPLVEAQTPAVVPA